MPRLSRCWVHEKQTVSLKLHKKESKNVVNSAEVSSDSPVSVVPDIVEIYSEGGFFIHHKSDESFRKMCRSINKATKIYLSMIRGSQEFRPLPE